MSINWRPATLNDIEPCLAIQVKSRGDALVGTPAAMDGWRFLARDPFFASAVLEATPPILGHQLIGLGAAIFLTPAFAESELADPRPDINSRLMAGIHAGQSIVATRSQIARANAEDGLDVLVLFGSWRDTILTPAERQEVQTVFATSFTEWLRGFRIRRIIHESMDEPARAFAQSSVVYQPIAAFPELGRVIHVMNSESVQLMPASLGNVIFSYREPVLRLRESDQQLLLAALREATDAEIGAEMGLALSAVKGRWRSTFERIAEARPDLVNEVNDGQGRGPQKRHRVLSYVRRHMEELRPYDWKWMDWKRSAVPSAYRASI